MFKYKLTKEIFIKRLNKIQPKLTVLGDYINISTKILVKDFLGIEYLVSPKNLLNGAYPSIQSAVNKKECLQLKLNNLNSTLRIIGNYKNDNSKIKVLDSLNIEYMITPSALLQGTIPSINSAIDKNLAFAIKSNSIHKNKYAYDKAIYINDRSKLIITCPIHGDFTQTATSHLQGHGCSMCVPRGFDKESWLLKTHPYQKAILYIIRCYDGIETFIKIGITVKTIEERFQFKTLPYKYEPIVEFHRDPETIWDFEKELHKRCKLFKYIPAKNFAGKTECFTQDVLWELTDLYE